MPCYLLIVVRYTEIYRLEPRRLVQLLRDRIFDKTQGHSWCRLGVSEDAWDPHSILKLLRDHQLLVILLEVLIQLHVIMKQSAHLAHPLLCILFLLLLSPRPYLWEAGLRSHLFWPLFLGDLVRLCSWRILCLKMSLEIKVYVSWSSVLQALNLL